MDWSKVRLRDFLNPKKWFVVFDAYRNKVAKGVTLELCQEVDVLYHVDQDKADRLATKHGVSVDYCRLVAYRADQCRECVNAGACQHCGCTAPENMFSIHNWCSAGRWVDFHDEQQISRFLNEIK